ncbi:MAG: hypothetical protein ABW003_03330 [Microvirga sp.]
MGSQVEHVARAFYDIVHDGKLWDVEFEIIKEEFRLFAGEAIDLLQQHQERSLMEAFCSVAIPKGKVELSGAL